MAVTKSKEKILCNYANGQWVKPDSEKVLEVTDPATNRVIAKIPISNKKDVDNVVSSAMKALSNWSKTPVPKRAKILFKYHSLLMENQDELAKTIVLENGKSYKEALGEVLRGIECVEFATGVTSWMKGETLSNIAEGIDSNMYRYPLGVVAGITPFNFPAMVPLWMFPLAIACGNTFVLKPSEQTPLLANKLVELFAEAGLPNGVLNLVHGSHDVVNLLLDHEVVKAVSFVGSQPVAKYVYERATKNSKRVQALSGAKNHHIVLADADIDMAVQQVISATFGNSGQRCMACGTVILIGNGGEFVELLKEKVEEIQIGPGLEDEVLLTPIIKESHLYKVLGYIENGIAEGAQLISDGRNKIDTLGEGNFLGPTIFDFVTPDMRIAQEEIFAPVLCLIRAEDFEQALHYLRISNYGNGACIYTNDAQAIRKFREEADAGMLGVNVGIPAPMAFYPFSGWKDSFYGDLHVNGQDGVNFYTRKKMITSRVDY